MAVRSSQILHLTTKDAKALALPGSDSFQASHLIYLDEFNRDAGVVRLCHEALKAFHDTIMINGRNAIEAERSNSYAWIDAGNSLLTSALPPNPVTLATLEWMNFENLKIAAGFELALKAKLLENDYIVQKIGRSDARYNTIAIAQEQTPIKKSDIFAIDGFRFDG